MYFLFIFFQIETKYSSWNLAKGKTSPTIDLKEKHIKHNMFDSPINICTLLESIFLQKQNAP